MCEAVWASSSEKKSCKQQYRRPRLETVKWGLPVGVLLHHLEQLERLQHLASHIFGSFAEVGRAHAVPLAATVDLGHGANTSAAAKVQVADCGC